MRFGRVIAAILLMPLPGIPAIGLLTASPASAASFDCTRARTAFAKAICGNPDLSKADDALAKAFAVALRSPAASSAPSLNVTEDKWVESAQSDCRKADEPASKPFDGAELRCLQKLFAERTAALSSMTAVGDLRFYSVVTGEDMTDPDPPEPVMANTTKIYSTPRIDNDDSFARAFNRLMASNLEEFAGTGANDELGADPTIDNQVKVFPEEGTSRHCRTMA